MTQFYSSARNFPRVSAAAGIRKKFDIFRANCVSFRANCVSQRDQLDSSITNNYFMQLPLLVSLINALS